MKKIFLIALTALLLGSGCKKEKPTVTIDGLTFGCKVNGKQFIPNDWDYGYNIPPLHIDFVLDAVTNNVDLYVTADKTTENIELHLRAPLTKGIHQLKFITTTYVPRDGYVDYGVYENGAAEYVTNDLIGGSVNLIEIDTVVNKVYGTFEFTGTDKNTGKQVKVTNGVFKNY